MKPRIKAITKTGIFFILLFLWSYIPIIFFNFDLNKLDLTGRVIYSLVCDITFLILIIFAYRKTLFKDFKDFFSDFLNNIEISFKYPVFFTPILRYKFVSVESISAVYSYPS